MPNTNSADLAMISQRAYKEWTEKTVLVNGCDHAYEGEFDLDKREIDIPVYGDLTIHKSTLDQAEAKPAPIEMPKGSTIRVLINKTRYTHWGKTTISNLMEKFQADDSLVRQRLTEKWAIDAEEELGIACARLPKEQHIDLKTILGQELDKTNILMFFDILKAKAEAAHMTHKDFELYASARLMTIARDAMLEVKGAPAGEVVRNGFVGTINDCKVNELNITALTKRDDVTALVEAEFAIWKAKDGIQYVVPFKATDSYDLRKNEVFFGGEGYMTFEAYDFFCLYKERLVVVDIVYNATATLPTFGKTGDAKVRNKDNLTAGFTSVH